MTIVYLAVLVVLCGLIVIHGVMTVHLPDVLRSMRDRLTIHRSQSKRKFRHIEASLRRHEKHIRSLRNRQTQACSLSVGGHGNDSLSHEEEEER